MSFDDVREAQALPVGPRQGSDMRTTTVGILAAIDASGVFAEVSVDGSQPIRLPCVPASYAGVYTVMVARNPHTGRAEQVLGPLGTWPVDTPEVPAPPAPLPPAPPIKVETATAVVQPVITGTYYPAANLPASQWWTTWGAGQGGGVSDLYQGYAPDRTRLIGFAGYGDQLANLGAAKITAIRLALAQDGVHHSRYPGVSVRPTPFGQIPDGTPLDSQSPTIYTAPIPPGEIEHVYLPAEVCDGMRRGIWRGLCLCGEEDQSLFGMSSPQGMALAVDYARPV